MRFAIAHREFLAEPNVADRVELDAALANPQHGIRRARVVGESQRVARARGVDGAPFADLDDHDPIEAPGAPPGFADADRLAANLADLAASRNRFAGVGPTALDTAGHDEDVVLLRIGGWPARFDARHRCGTDHERRH